MEMLAFTLSGSLSPRVSLTTCNNTILHYYHPAIYIQHLFWGPQEMDMREKVGVKLMSGGGEGREGWRVRVS